MVTVEEKIQDYHSELVKLGYEIINHEDGTGYISDPDGKLLAEWDKKDDCYRWAGPDNGGLWLANDDDWPDFEKEIYERHSKQNEI